MCPKLLKEIEDEITDLLSDLIKIDTTNPPGNETKAAKYLASTLEKEGFKCELYESAPGRGSVVTRIEGNRQKSNLILLSHLDVVAANKTEWSVDPFGGVVKDKFVWGRGALDMKSMTAMEVMVVKLLKRNGAKLKGDVILAATADEEKGGEMGAGWLVQNHPDRVQAEHVINEGGGTAVPSNGKNLFTIQTAEKGIYWFKIKAKGTPGHGSVPGAADNSIMRMSQVVATLGNHRSKITIVPTVRQYLNELSKQNKHVKQAMAIIEKSPEKSDEALDQLSEYDSYIAEELRARMRMTVTPTMINGGVKENVIPSQCEAVFDCRVLPGQSPAGAMAEIKSLLADVDLDKLEFETIEASEPSESRLDTALYELMVKTIKDFDKNCSVAPVMLTGGTDSRFFRQKGIACYGFHPLKADMPYGAMQKTIHGIDERVSIENLVFGTSVLYEVIERFMT